MGIEPLSLNLDHKYDFFKDCRLGLITSDYPHYKLVNEINQALNFHFKREPKLDIVFYSEDCNTPVQNTLAIDLFSHVSMPPVENKYFPLHRYFYPHSSIEMYIISNRCQEELLVPQLKHVNYYFIIRHAENLTFEEDIFNLLSKVKVIRKLQEVEMETFEYRASLQFE